MLLIVLLIVGVVFACLGGWVASQKHRDAGEGVALGFLFGPLGVLVEALLPTLEARREPDSEKARSFKAKAKLTDIVAINEHDRRREREERRAIQAREQEERRVDKEHRREEQREWTQRMVWRFGWFKALPDTLQPIVLGLAVATPIVAALVFFMAQR